MSSSPIEPPFDAVRVIFGAILTIAFVALAITIVEQALR